MTEPSLHSYSPVVTEGQSDRSPRSSPKETIPGAGVNFPVPHLGEKAGKMKREPNRDEIKDLDTLQKPAARPVANMIKRFLQNNSSI